MKTAPRGAWRSLRCLLLVACAGGILAADDSWVGTVRLDFLTPQEWFSGAVLKDAPNLSAASDTAIEAMPRAQMSMGGLLHGLLFSRPSGSWALDSRALEMKSSIGARVVEYDQINQGSGDNFPAFTTTAAFTRVAAVSAPASISGSVPNAVTAVGTWAVDSSGNWSDPANWTGGTIPGSAGDTADFSQVNLTANRTVTLDSSRSVGYLTIGDTNGTHSYTLTGAPNATLTFDHTPNFGFTGILTQSAGSAGDNIAANIVIGNVNYLSVRNDSAAPLTISGGISSSNGVKTIQFDGTGSFLVSGVISNGGTGNSVQVGASGGGILTLTGTNTYTGGTTALNSSTILINGDSSGAIGQVSVVNSGTLGGTGTIGGSVSVGNGTITGGTDTTVGTLTIGTVTLHQNVSFQGGESFGTYLVNLAGSTSDKLAITGSLDLHFFDQITFSGMADGTTTYVLATYESHNGVFDSVLNLPAGYSLVYLGTELDLVPTAIPEPATWIGGALALGAIVCAKRKRSRVIG